MNSDIKLTMPSQRVAVLGLGGMGRALADRLDKLGHQIVVWNRTPGKGAGLNEVPTAAEAVGQAQVVFVAVHGGQAVQQVLNAEVRAALPPAARVLVVSSLDPATVQELEKQLPGRLLDTPILGSPEMVSAGRCEFLVGGAADSVKAVAPLLRDVGAKVTHCGVTGTAAVLKILSNAQLVVGVGALAEAVATARTHGVSDDTLTAVFGDSLMVSPGASLGLHGMLDPAHTGQLGPVADAVRDIELALDLAPEIATTLYPAALALLLRVADHGWPDFTALVEGLEPEPHSHQVDLNRSQYETRPAQRTP